jgi:hypothetical protein
MSWGARQSACAGLSALSALTFAACGGSSSSSSSASSSTTSASAPVQVAHPKTPIPRPLGVGRDQIRASRTEPVRARPPQAGTDDDEVSSTGRKIQNPCTLLSQTEVQTALHQQVGKPVEAPQGPTCIYAPQNTGRQITVAVESLPFSKIKPQAQLQDRISLTVAGHSAYCGTSGGQRLIIPLGENRYLTVAAPCPIAASLAAKAIGRIA